MNDIFYALAKEAETLAYAELLGMPKTSHPWEDIFRQKYGELVVNECVLLGNFAHESDMYPDAVIKEHFEMEEVK
jgi:hypothetical protein